MDSQKQPVTRNIPLPSNIPGAHTHTPGKFTKKALLHKVIQVSSSTFISRILGVVREVLMVQYLGASALSDAFLTAYKIPNSLRKIFAEGALSAAFIPTIVQSVRKNDKEAVNSLMTLGFIVFEGMVLMLCILAMFLANWLVRMIAPGFSPEQIEHTATYLKIVMPFILLISSSALLAGALQAVGHFFVPAFSPVLLNIVFIGSVMTCLHYNLPVTYLCWSIVFGGVLQLLWHFVAYQKLNFNFGTIKKDDVKKFTSILSKFFLCLIPLSIVEINLFIDTGFASYLSKGSLSLLYYANRFMGIPQGMFAVALSTILLPHFSHISTYAPKRLSFYLLESTKLVFWVTIPVSLLMGFFAEKIFYTTFLSDKFTLPQVYEAAQVLIAFLIGLSFFSINKILLNIYYALHATAIPAFITCFAVIVNVVINWCLLSSLQATGLALATTISGIVQTLLFFVILHHKFNFNLYLKQLFTFVGRYLAQLALIAVPFVFTYHYLTHAIETLSPTLANALLYKLSFWLWVGPLCALTAAIIFYTRKFFKIRLYFIDG